MMRIRFSQFAIKLISESIESILTRILTPVAKVLVLDCDNTIWGGVIGEAGLRGILIGQDGLGKAFTEFQNSIKEKFKLFSPASHLEKFLNSAVQAV